MILIPQSIRSRLLLVAIIAIAGALLFTSLSVGTMLERFVKRGVNDRLDTQIALLVRTVRPDATVDMNMLTQIGPFTRYNKGWAWRIDGPKGTVNSDFLVPKTQKDAEERHFEEMRKRWREHGDAVLSLPRPSPWSGSSDAFYYRVFEQPTSAGNVSITVAAPRYIADRPLNHANKILRLALISLGTLLLLAILLQLYIGLRPLARLRTALKDVRSGKISRIPDKQPTELRDLVTELNSLLDENETALARARGHVSNLAHGLKTPLATLSLRLNESAQDSDGSLAALVSQIEHSIRHHLARARAASPGAPGRPSVPVARHIHDLTDALIHIHADKAATLSQTIADDLHVKCDPQDLDEMIGNLLDNAWKWARSKIHISAYAEGQEVIIRIEDDGPGLTDAGALSALLPGYRLDEQKDGHGFGLPITRELAELHGGSLALERSNTYGGLCATLILPH